MPIYGTWPQDDGYVWLNLLKSLAANSVSWGLLLMPFSLGELVVLCAEPRFPRLLAFFYGASLCWGLPLLMDHPECLAGRELWVSARALDGAGSWEV